MRKIIALALITSFAITGAAIAQTAGGGNGQGSRGGNAGPDGPGAGDNGPVAAAVISRRPTYKPRPAPKKVEFCHIAGTNAPTDYECGHNSR